MDATFQTKILRRQRSPDEYALYRAALEWDLTDPIVIEKRQDFKSEYRWRSRMEPYRHQVENLITFCRRLPVTLLADDVGLGKTVSAGMVVSELISRSRVAKILVVCPKLLGPQWKEELETKFDIPAEVAVGQQLVRAVPNDVGAVITTYASARLHLDSIPEDRYEMLILDEAHKLRNLYGVESPPQVAKRFRKALADRRFRFVLMLTATPIHNRLWDLYSLVDLLTVARGHENPFGSEGMFARKFIADSRDQARQLKPGARDEFRAIVYGYMSRVRRGDAQLYFPEREIQMHKVDPTSAERQLIHTIAKPIQQLNRLAQISILQALASSPDALMAQLNNMARNRTVPESLASAVRDIVLTMPLSAKLQGLQALIDRLKRENPAHWRLVIFTTRIETQTTIQTFLEKNGLKVGIINGTSGSRNQETLTGFRKDPPACHVIVSTEAGSEGVNLQVANMLVNYDLPWNPMVVEQRIGRVQRLASKHAKVGIFNIILRGTFEEYIIGRLMEKLQMASHAIGDIDALLQAAGIDDEDENVSFDERIRQLVVAALANKDVELETRQAEESIAKAKAVLEREQSTIQELLGDPNGKEYVGPRAPTLAGATRSMESREFTVRALAALGAQVTETASGVFIEQNGGTEFIHFVNDTPSHPKSTLYAPGTPAFSRLVSQIVATGVHDVRDLDDDAADVSKAVASEWANRFGAIFSGMELREVHRRFRGIGVVRVRATVAHDAYERLVQVRSSGRLDNTESSRSFIAPLAGAIDDPRALGLDVTSLSAAAQLDDSIGEFCRFYAERRELEVRAAGANEGKRRKLEDDFTPRLEMSLVGLDGELHRDVNLYARYKIDDVEYSNSLTIRPHAREIVDRPQMGRCSKTGRVVPQSCLAKCQVSGAEVLSHLLVRSDKSNRTALPEFAVVCGLSEKRLLQDEVEKSGVTGRLIDKDLLRTSALSGTKGEPEHFAQCEFSGTEVLLSELATSEISGRRYRQDQRRRSVVSGKTGHKDEFVICSQTGHSLIPSEAERCAVTNSYVQPGILEECAVTHKRVLPGQLAQCEVTGKRVLASELVTSSVSGMRMLQQAAIRSATGKFCAPSEVGQCIWSGRKCHPDDLRTCSLTGLSILFQFAGSAQHGFALQPLLELVEGIRRTTDKQELWPTVARAAAIVLGGGRCRIEAAMLSPTGLHLAACVQVRTLLGLKVQQAGLVYAIAETTLVGRVARGQRGPGGWTRAQR